jgi:hypothetical protein
MKRVTHAPSIRTKTTPQQKLLDMIVTTAGTLIGMAYASAIDTNKRGDRDQSWRRRADRNLIDANRVGLSWRS